MCGVLIITVDHQSAELTARIRENLKRIRGNSDMTLIIVRNGISSDVAGSTRSAPESLDNVWIHESAANHGYFGGAKQGLAWFQKMQGELPPWIIVCNNDIRIEQADFFERLSQLDPNGVGVIAPKIISSRTGLNQNPFMVQRPGRGRVVELRFWLKSYYLAFAHEKLSEWKKTGVSLKRRLLPRTSAEVRLQPTFIYAPHGSFLIFSKEFFAQGGFLDDRSFMYHEEISVAEICRKIGLPVVHCPELCVLHDEHSTTGRLFTRAIYECQRQSLQYLSTNYLSDLV